MKPIILRTERLTLRRANEKDSKNLFLGYFSDSYSSHFLTREAHHQIEQTDKFLNEWCLTPWDKESDRFAWVIALADSDKGIGIFLVELKDLNSAQIHFGINHNFSRQGLITEAGTAVVQWLKNQKTIHRIWTVCDLSNQGSIRVLEKLGFQREGIRKNYLNLPAFNDSPRDCYVYAYPSEKT